MDKVKTVELIVSAVRKDKRKRGWRVYSLYRCYCGVEFIARDENVKSGNTKSCGCINVARAKAGLYHKHEHCAGGKITKTYRSWDCMKARCLRSSSPNYHNYGGRGIKVCERWLDSFKNFLADMGERPLNMTLDRIDSDGDYTPNNCRWADSKTQAANKRRQVK